MIRHPLTSLITIYACRNTRGDGTFKTRFHGTKCACNIGPGHKNELKPCNKADCCLCSILKNGFDIGRARWCGLFGPGIYSSSCSSSESFLFFCTFFLSFFFCRQSFVLSDAPLSPPTHRTGPPGCGISNTMCRVRPKKEKRKKKKGGGQEAKPSPHRIYKIHKWLFAQKNFFFWLRFKWLTKLLFLTEADAFFRNKRFWRTERAVLICRVIGDKPLMLKWAESRTRLGLSWNCVGLFHFLSKINFEV